MPDPLSSILPDWQTAGLIAALLLLVAAAVLGQRMRTRIRQLSSALDYMAQGLCMFDHSSRSSSATSRFCACTSFQRVS
jgi:hypothetical protein